MKTVNRLLSVGVLVGLTMSSGGQDNHPPGEINMQGCLPSSALLIYRQLTHTELIIDSRAKEISTLIFLKTDHPVSDAEATKLMEKAFIEQTGLVITHLEGKKVSVTYNDALPIVATKQGKESAR